MTEWSVSHKTKKHMNTASSRVSRKIKSAVCLSAHLSIFLFWRENTTDFKSVNVVTNEQIWFFSADCRPGTIFLLRLYPRESEPSLFPKDRKTHDFPLHTNIQPPHHKPFLSFVLARRHWWVQPMVVNDLLVKSTTKTNTMLSMMTKIQRVLAPPSDDDDKNDEFN